ncbi:hypothetical protein PoB_004975900, partial [Plakobranchus ocellatus]
MRERRGKGEQMRGRERCGVAKPITVRFGAIASGWQACCVIFHHPVLPVLSTTRPIISQCTTTIVMYDAQTMRKTPFLPHSIAILTIRRSFQMTF